MAIQERFVDPSQASSDGTGTRATISLSAATFTFSTLNLNETNAFSGYTFVTGDEIFLSGGTAVTTGFHTIASRTDASNIVMSADITSDSSDPTDVTADSKPYGDLQFGLDTADHPASGGGRINIKIGAGDGGTDEILAAALNLNTSGTGYLQTNATSASNYLIFQGYTTQADDGGIGGISGNNTVAILDSVAQSFLIFRDLHIHNVGDNFILNLGNDIGLINCEFDASTKASDTFDFNINFVAIGCLFHDIQGNALGFTSGKIYRNKFIDDGASNAFATAIIPNSVHALIVENIIWLDSVGANGILYDVQAVVIGNSIFQNTIGTGKGIAGRTANAKASTILNNLVEGFSGVAAVGIEQASTDWGIVTAGNYVSDCTTSYGNAGNVNASWDNEDVSDTTPFTDGANKDFSPVDTGNIKEKSQPTKIGLFTV